MLIYNLIRSVVEKNPETCLKQAIATESWPGGEPQREEEDLWDDGRLQVNQF